MSGRKWQSLMSDALKSVYPALEAMTDAELRNLRSAPKKATQTNCWWLAFQCVPPLATVARDMLKARARKRRAERKAKL